MKFTSARQLHVAGILLLAATSTQAGTGSDTWTGGAGTANWLDAANWSGANTPPAAKDSLVFGTVGSGGATLNNNLTAGTSYTNLTFSSGSPSFVLAGNSVVFAGAMYDYSANPEYLNLNFTFDVTHSVNVTPGGELTFGGVLGAGTYGLTKAGAGSLTLTNNNLYTGATTISGGTLTNDFTGGAANNIISASSALSMGGGALVINGSATAVKSQAFASTAITAGNNVISAAPVSGANNPTVGLGAMTESAGGTVEFVGPVTTNASATVPATASITTTPGAAIGTFGAVGGFGVGKNGAFATVGAYDFAATNTSGVVVGGSQVNGFYQKTGITTTTAFYDVNSAGVNTLGNAAGSEGFRFNAPSALTITFSATTAQSIQGILVTPGCGANNETITGGGLEFIRSTSGGNCYGVIWQNNPLGYLNFASAINGGRQAGQDNGLVQAGPGTVVYTGANAYELGSYLNGGYSVVTADNGFGLAADASTVTLNGGTVVGNATFTMDNAGANLRPFVLGNNGGGLAATAGHTMTIDGVVSGAGALTVGIPATSANNNTAGLLPGSGSGTANTTAVNGTGTVLLDNTTGNSYSGGTVILGGATLNINSEYALGGANYGGLTFNNGTLQYASTLLNAVTDISANTVTLAGNGSLDVNGHAISLANSIGNGGAGTLTVQSTTAGGTLYLLGANNYSGGTTVSSGTLLVNNTSGSATGSGAVTVANGATLGGTGTIAGNVTWQTSAMALVTNGLPLTISGSLTLNNNTLTVSVPGSTPLAVGSYTLMTYNATGSAGSFNASPAYAGAGAASGTASTITTSGGTVTLNIISTGISATWIDTASGNWSAAANWSSSPSIPSLPGDAAILGTGSVLTTVTLDANETVGQITFNNANSFVVANAGNTLTLDNKGSGASLTATAGTQNAIQAPVALNDNVSVSVSSGDSLTLSGTIANSSASKTLAIGGAGTTVLSVANSYGPAAGSTGTTVSGGTLQLGNSGALGAGDLAVSGSSTLQAGTALNLANNIAIGSSVTTTVDNNGNNITLAGNISGSGSLSKPNPGTLVLSGANSYSGSTVVGNGALSIAADANLGTAPGSATPNSLVLGSSTADLLFTGSATLNANRGVGIGAVSGSTGSTALIDVAGGQTATIGGILASAGNTGVNGLAVNSVSGSGNLVLGAANAFTGPTVIAGGTLTLGNSLALQSSTLNYNGGVLGFGSLTAATLGGLAGGQNLALVNGSSSAVALTVGGDNDSTTYGGILSGTGSLTKNGSGTFTLTNQNSFSGGITANAGDILVSNSYALGFGAITRVTGFIQLADGVIVTNTWTESGNDTSDSQLDVPTAGTVGTWTGPVNGSSSVQFRCAGSGGTLVFSNSPIGLASSIFVVSRGTVDFAGGTVLNAGSGLLGRPSAAGINTTLLLKDNASLTFGTSASLGGGKASGNLELTLQDSALLACGTEFDMNSSATAGAVSTLNLNGGTLMVGSLTNSTGNPGIVNFNGGVLKANANNAAFLTAISGLTNVVTTGGAKINDNGMAITIGQPLIHDTTLGSTADGGLTKLGSGTLTLTNGNTYTGNTTISAGTLALSGLGSVSSSPNIAVTGGNARLDVSTLPGFALGAGQSLTGIGVVTGAVTTVSGTILNAGNGGVGTLSFSNNLTLNATSTNLFAVTSAGGSSNLVAVAGAMVPNGSVIKVTTGTALLPSTNTLFTYGSVSGTFNPSVVLDVAPVHPASLVDDAAGHIKLVVPNSAPVANANTYSRNGLSSWKIAVSDLLTNATDPDGDAVTLVGVGTSSDGITLSVSGKWVIYYNPNQVDDQFTYTVTDPYGATNTATITLTSASSGPVTGQPAGALTVSGTTATMSFAGIPGYTYNVQRSTDLVNWTTIWTTNAPSTGVFQFIDNSAPPSNANYRLSWGN